MTKKKEPHNTDPILVTLLERMSNKLTEIEQKTIALERENWSMATYIAKLEGRIRELESDSDI